MDHVDLYYAVTDGKLNCSKQSCYGTSDYVSQHGYHTDGSAGHLFNSVLTADAMHFHF